jgi:hypothetical protein
MGKMYTLAIVSKAAQREAKLGSLLSDSDDALDIPFEFVWNKNGKIKKEITLHTKAYKTLGGASRECSKINTKFANKSMRMAEGYVLNGRWTTSFNFDTSQYAIVVIDISEKWNQHIDKEIQKETAIYNKTVQKLNSLKV